MSAASFDVTDCPISDFASRETHRKEYGLVLYLPEKTSNNPTFEIILHRPTTGTLVPTFSLFRANNLDDADVKFTILRDKLPVFIEIAKEMYNINGLQKVCDVLSEHPTWTVAHLAAYFDLYDSFNHPKVNCFLNSSNSEKGMSPLQVAIATRKLKTVQMLVAANCSLEHLDRDWNSVFHYASTTTKDIIAALAQGSPPKCLNFLNKKGYAPLHMAVLANHVECVEALLKAGADLWQRGTGEGSDFSPLTI